MLSWIFLIRHITTSFSGKLSIVTCDFIYRSQNWQLIWIKPFKCWHFFSKRAFPVILTFSCEVIRLRHLVLLKSINKMIKWWHYLRPFRHITAAISVHCCGSKNSLNDKRYNCVFIKANAARIAYRSREKRSKIPLSTEHIEVCVSVTIILFVWTFFPLVIRCYLRATIGNSNLSSTASFSKPMQPLKSRINRVIVVDFLEKFSHWINGIAFHHHNSRLKEKHSPLSIAASRDHSLSSPRTNKTHKLDKYSHGRQAHRRFWIINNWVVFNT